MLIAAQREQLEAALAPEAVPRSYNAQYHHSASFAAPRHDPVRICQ